MMTGEELRDALRSEMAATTPPPPMSTAVALSTARRARLRRGMFWGCIGSAAAVLAVTGVAALSLPGAGVLDAGGLIPQVMPWAEDTREPMPTGPDGQPQEDRTARAGARYEQGVRLLNQIVTVIPAGYTAPENPTTATADEIPLRYHQANFEERVDGVEIWGYMAYAAVAKGDQMGRVLVEVHTAGNRQASDPCELAQQFWGAKGTCQTVTVGAATVGVVVQPTDERRFDQWAAYRHPDGVVVFVAQGMSIFGSNRPALSELPFTVEGLAALAADERFHLQ